MTHARVELIATAVYLAITLTVSYTIWGPYDGVEYDPAWADSAAFYLGLLVLHAVVGFAIGRWRALGLPLLWALLSIPAEGYDAPVAVLIGFGAFFWLPAVPIGVVPRQIARRRPRPS